MVVSLESQKVKGKRTFYQPRRDLDFNLPYNLIRNINFKRIDSRKVITITSFALISMFFVVVGRSFVPAKKADININSIQLPYHRAEVGIRNAINSYKGSQRYNLYQDHKYISNETISSIAIKYGVSIDTILHVNGIKDIGHLENHTNLVIPRINGVIHKVEDGDTLDGLYKKYSVPVKEIFRVNGLKSETLVEGSEIFIPGLRAIDWGFKSDIDKYFIYPVKGYITKRYGDYINSVTGLKSHYEGIDFAPVDNLRVYASKGGQVSRVGYNASYGNYVFIDHSGGMRTLYAHLDAVNVAVRDRIKQNSVIGTVGNSGYVKKRKLFFCILEKGETVNPEKYLK